MCLVIQTYYVLLLNYILYCLLRFPPLKTDSKLPSQLLPVFPHPIHKLGLALQLIGGVVVTETVFAIPGVGRLVVDSVQRHDYPVIQSVLLISAAVYVFINLLIDLSYRFFDPRIQY